MVNKISKFITEREKIAREFIKNDKIKKDATTKGFCSRGYEEGALRVIEEIKTIIKDGEK